MAWISEWGQINLAYGYTLLMFNTQLFFTNMIVYQISIEIGRHTRKILPFFGYLEYTG
jgi:hypothetical protein